PRLRSELHIAATSQGLLLPVKRLPGGEPVFGRSTGFERHSKSLGPPLCLEKMLCQLLGRCPPPPQLVGNRRVQADPMREGKAVVDDFADDGIGESDPLATSRLEQPVVPLGE